MIFIPHHCLTRKVYITGRFSLQPLSFSPLDLQIEIKTMTFRRQQPRKVRPREETDNPRGNTIRSTQIPKIVCGLTMHQWMAKPLAGLGSGYRVQFESFVSNTYRLTTTTSNIINLGHLSNQRPMNNLSKSRFLKSSICIRKSIVI